MADVRGLKRCAKCFYGYKINGNPHHVICDYAGITGNVRITKCPPGNKCTEFIPTNGHKRPNRFMEIAPPQAWRLYDDEDGW